MTKPVPKPSAADAAKPKGALELTGKAGLSATADPVVDQYRRKLSMALF